MVVQRAPKSEREEEEVKMGLHSHQMLRHSEHSRISGTALKRGHGKGLFILLLIKDQL